MSNANNNAYRRNINKSKKLLQNIENVLRKGGPGSKNSGNIKPVVPGPTPPGPNIPGPTPPGPTPPGPTPPDPTPPGPNIPGPNIPGPNIPGPTPPGPNIPRPNIPGPIIPGPNIPGPNIPGPTPPGPTPPGPTPPGPVPPPPSKPNKKIVKLGNNINTGNSFIKKKNNSNKQNKTQFGPTKIRGSTNNTRKSNNKPKPIPPPPPKPVPPPPPPAPKKNIKVKSIVSQVNTTKKNKTNNIKNNTLKINKLNLAKLPEPPKPEPQPKKKPTRAEIERWKAANPGQWQKILAMWEEEKKTQGLDPSTGIRPSFVAEKVAELMAQEQKGGRRRRTRKNRCRK